MPYRVVILLISYLLSTVSYAQPGHRLFTRQQVLSDLAYLYESLHEAHYDVHTYTSQQNLLDNYHRVMASVSEDSLSYLQATNTFQSVASAINNGHTEVDFPVAAYLDYAQAGGTVFPLEIALEDGRCFVRKNFSTDKSVAVGAEILSLDSISMEDVVAQLYPQISAERPYLKHAKIETYSFPRMHWRVFGSQDSYAVVVAQEGGDTVSHVLPAISVVNGYEAKREEVLNAKMAVAFYREVAYLNPGNFSGDEQAYRSFIDSAFTVINDHGGDKLIIDLRNNAGGDDAFSDYLVSYLADKPFSWTSNFTLKTSQLLKDHVRTSGDTSSAYAQAILTHENGDVFEFEFEDYRPQPPNKRFTGKTFVLINRQSHSQSAVTAAQLQDYGWATIVGEETGDYPTLLASQFQFILPETNISVKVSKGMIVRVSGNRSPRGVIPDVPIKDHLLDERDEMLSELLHRLEGSQNTPPTPTPTYVAALAQYEAFERAQGKYLTTRNSELHYVKVGQSKDKTILWLHGTFGNAYDFLPLASKLQEQGYGSLAVDYYGHGQTSLHNDTVSIYHLADDLRELLLHEGVENCLVVGVSRGGMIATAFYDEYPELVSGIVLIDGGSVPWTANVQKLPEDVARQKLGSFTPPADTLFSSREEAFIFYNRADDESSWKVLNAIREYRVKGKTVWSSNYGLRQWLWESSLDQVMDGAYRPHTLPLFAASSLLVEPRIVYRNLAVPMLIIDPIKEGDWLMNFESRNRALMRMHPDLIDHKVYPDTYHNVLYDKPARLYEDIIKFISNIE